MGFFRNHYPPIPKENPVSKLFAVHRIHMILFFIFACVVPTEETTWSGNVYGLFAAQLETATADLNLLSTDGALLTSSETPYSDSPQYHIFSLEPDLLVQDVQILVSGSDFYPTLYIGTTPQNSAIWLK